MKNVRSITSLIVNLLSLLSLHSGCADRSANNPTLPAAFEAKLPSPPSGQQATLGRGYSSAKELMRGECLEGRIVQEGRNEANLEFKQSISEASLQKELGFAAEGRAQIGVVDVSAAAKFLSNSKADSYSVSAIYSGGYQFKNRILVDPRLTETGRSLRADDDRWADGCGDEYVKELIVGAKIFFSIRIDFTSQSDKEAFSASFKADAPLFSAAGSLNTASSQLSKKTKVTVSAYQMGGDVRQLSKIFVGKNSNGEDTTAPFVECSLGQFSQCSNVLKNALHYATISFPEQLHPWKNDPDKPVMEGGPAVLYYETVPYITAGIYRRNAPIVAREVGAARTQLARYLDTNYVNSIRVQRFLSGGSRRLSSRQNKLMTETAAKISENMVRIVKAAQLCYDTPGLECVEVVQAMDPSVKDGLTLLNEDDLIIESESFAQFCDEGLSPQSTLELRTSIETMIELARSLDRGAFLAQADQTIDECQISSRILASQKKLDLSKKGLVDLRPLTSFSQLEDLDLSGNQVIKLGVFESSVGGGFANLKRLNLAGNQIKDPTPLNFLINLEELDLKSNQIHTPFKLSQLTRMIRLDLRNNSRSLVCPIPNQEVCLTSDYGQSGQFYPLSKTTSASRFGHTLTPIPQRGEESILIVGSLDQTNLAELFRKTDQGFLPKLFDSGSPVPIRFHSANLLTNGSVLLLGGVMKDDGWIYDPLTNDFKMLKTRMQKIRALHTATLLNDGKVLITGGVDTRGGTSSVEIFDPETETFAELGTGLSVNRWGHTATLLPNGDVLLVGGLGDRSGVLSADLYDFKNNRIVSISSRMTVGRGLHQATLLKSGKVLLSGGFDGTRGIQTAELFDPSKRTFITLPALMTEARGAHQATLLSNGLVLLTGGQRTRDATLFNHEECSDCSNTAELFDPAMGDFVTVRSEMNHSRSLHAALAIGPGSVLIVGGRGEGAGVTAEIYSYGTE